MTTEDALIQLAESTGAAIEQVLEIVSSAKIERSHVAVVPSGESPLRSIPVPAVAANVSYVRRRHRRQHLRHDAPRRPPARRGDDGHGARR